MDFGDWWAGIIVPILIGIASFLYLYYTSKHDR